MAKIFSIPDKGKNYKKYMLYAISNIWSATIMCIVSVGFVFFPNLWQRWLVLFIVSIFIAIITNFLNQRWKTKIASWIFVTLLWLLITIPCLTAGGIRAPGIITQVSVILTAGFLLGYRNGLAFGVLSMITDFLFVLMEIKGLLPIPKVNHTPLTFWIGSIIPFGTIVALQYYATNHLRQGLVTMKNEIKKRKKIEKEKNISLYQLNERIKELTGLFSVSQILQEESEDDFDKSMTKIAELIPSSWQFPEVCTARLIIDNHEYHSVNFQPSKYFQMEKNSTKKGTQISIEVFYIEKMPEFDEGPFLIEERQLLSALAEMIKNNIEKREHSKELNDYKYAIDKATIVSIADSEGKLTYVNENFCKLSRYSFDELIGAHWSVISSGLQPQEYFDEIKSEFQRGRYFRGEFCNKAKDGSLYWVDSTVVPFYDKNGEVLQILSINNDITERKEAEKKIRQSEQFLRKTTSHIPANTYVFTLENDTIRFLFTNSGTEEDNHNLTFEDLDKNPEKLLLKIYADDKERFIETLRKTERTKSNLSIQYRISINEKIRWRWLRASSEVTESGQVIWYGSSSDITPLVEYIVSIEQFVFDISHVIRRPISNMLGLTNLINDDNISDEEIRFISLNLHKISKEMDDFVRELNKSYINKKQTINLDINFSSLVDKRSTFFK